MKVRGLKKSKVGVVVRDKMDKSVIVSVERKVKHPKFGKYIIKATKYMCHDEKDECKVGDKVILVHSRPISKMKRWRIERIVKSAQTLDNQDVKTGTQGE